MGEQIVRVGLESMGYILKNKLQMKCLINPLEEERRKIQAFGGELPLCMILLNDVIDQLKQECEEKVEHEDMEWEHSVVEMDWIEYDQNWNTNYNEHNSNIINDFDEMENDNDACVESQSSNE
ncbi:uncharacterized protein LOC110023842 [Phalaenopsis equestris]|uniref:uncharacterized protein LOC110023842 n=1 Tax=Phalaenopsis equestris TaxID=78828 RepID=UPI0009E33CBC|nr:uncharacterized protein LOC110023842 [Phalaenopsis equestris]